MTAQTVEIQAFDNSRDGNDCCITEIWYKLPVSLTKNIVVRMTKYSDLDNVDLDQYKGPLESMPNDVKLWF